jgi:F-box and leucine-rich repeat protein 7
VEGCTRLEVFDVSQCKNLTKWLEHGGVEKCKRLYGGIGGRRPREVKFLSVAADKVVR